ncbi:MAG: glutamate--tRNA ligase, partial [Betaproteobacteria bacterium]|nr:glutamate--tRNA ligase [Betaproteobacteria bacterium]
AASLRGLGETGFLPDAVINYLARAGCAFNNATLLSKTELAKMFSPALISKSPAAFDFAALMHWQKKAAHNLTAAACAEWLSRAFADSAGAPPPREFAAFCAATRENIALYEDARAWAQIIADDFPPLTEAAKEIIKTAGAEFYAKAAAAVAEDMEWKPFCEKIKTATGCKGKNLFMPLRAALTGRTDGPEMPPLFKLIGAEKAKMRLKNAKCG